MDASRIARVVVKDGSGAWLRIGSGYRVSSTAILTAAHVLGDAKSESVEVSLDVGGDGEWTSPVLDLWTSPGDADIGVVAIDATEDEGITPALFGRVSRDRDAVLGFTAAGFPRWKLRDDDESGPFRDLEQAHGYVPVLSNRREGTLGLELDGPPGRDPEPEHSPWEGMSGAAVLVGDRVVGIVAEHHRQREGLAHLSARPLAGAYRALAPKDLARLCALVGLPPALEELTDVVPSISTSAALVRATKHVNDVLPDALDGREHELDDLTAFCAGNDLYRRVQGGAWTGKTALLAWFVAHPPAGLAFASHFIRRANPSWSDSDAFLGAMTEQLGAIAGQVPERTTDLQGEFERLLDAADRACRERNERLILVIDGLDEDTSLQRDKIPVAVLLPTGPPTVRVLVAGRSFSDLPDQVPADHPIRHCPSLDVAQTGAVRDLEVRALAELREQANTPVAREILRLVTASGGGLSAADLSELAGVDRFDVDAAVTGGLGRSLQCVDGSSDDCGYIYAHASLLETAATLLQRDIPKYRAKINDWGATWARAGWPDETPGYLTGLYSRLLLEQADVVTLTELAIDPARHGLLYRRTHADAAALRECRDAHQLWCRSDRPDLVAVGQLTAQRCLLDVRSSKLLSLIPVLWATLGEPDRAEQLANSFTDLEKRATVLADIADALAPVDPDRADDIVESAEQNARSVDDPADRTSALIGVAERIAATNPDRAAAIARSAEQIARSIADPWRRDLGLARVAEFVAAANQDEAETIALSIEDSESRCRALITVAREIGARHPDHAQDLAQMAEQILRSIERPSAWIAAAVAQKMTAIDPDRAEAIARSIDDPSSRWNALAVIAVDVAASDPERAEVLGRSIDEPDRRARALAAVAVQIAATDPDRAEEIARSIEDPGGRAWSLAQVAVEMAPTDSRRARRLAESAEEIALASAEQIARVNQDSWELLAVVASDLAATAGPDRAEAVARALDDPVGRARVLGRVASQIADTDPDRAEAIARSIDDPEERADALAFVAARIVATDRERARSMLESGEQLLRSIESPDDWARTLAGVAEHIASTDPDRAESVARSIRDADYRSIALVDVAEQLASTDPDRAETLARSISDPRGRSRALASVAERVAPNDPDRARTIVDAAQQSAASIEDADDRSWAVTRAADVARFAEVLGADSDRVESLAESIEDLARRSEALAGHAKHIATTDPLSALDVAGSIPLLEVRLEALVDVVERIAAGDPRRAEALTQSIGSPEIRVLLMVAVIEHIAEDDTDGAKAIGETAERIARSIDDPAVGALLVANVAASIAVADPDRMAAIADSIEDPFLLAEVAKRVVGSDPDRAHDMAESAARSAELMAQSLDAPMRRALVLAALAEQLATVDSDRARALAESAWDVARSIAERPTWMLDDMVQVAGSLAIADPDRARTVASLIEVPEVRAEALANIAERIAAGDPRRATNMVCAGLLSDEWTTFLPAMGLVDPTAVAGLVDSLLVPA